MLINLEEKDGLKKPKNLEHEQTFLVTGTWTYEKQQYNDNKYVTHTRTIFILLEHEQQRPINNFRIKK